MPLYFAYGADMDKEGLYKWCKKYGENPVKLANTCVAVLKDYELTFNVCRAWKALKRGRTGDGLIGGAGVT
jgi:hypothetical protein